MDIQLFTAESGTGYPLVLLHGNGEDHTYFAAQIAPLSQIRRVIAVDTRGHGAAPRGSAPFTLSQFADDLCVLMDAKGIRQADMLGFSDGGNIALLFALRHPGRVRRLVLSGANLYPRGMVLPAYLAIWATYLMEALTAGLPGHTGRKRDLYRLMAKEPIIRPAALGALDVPTLVIAGTHDLIRTAHTRLIARSLPHAKLVLIDGGHAIAQEQPEAFNQAVCSFLMEAPQDAGDSALQR